MKLRFTILMLLFFISLGNASIEEIPVLYKGRFRPLSAAAQLEIHTGSLGGSLGPETAESFFLKKQFINGDAIIFAIPTRKNKADWAPFNAILQKDTYNFSYYSSQHFEKIQREAKRYQHEIKSQDSAKITINKALSLSEKLLDAYKELEGKPYVEGPASALTFPTLFQLKTEVFYYKAPLLEISLFFLALGLIFYKIPVLSIIFNAGGFFLIGTIILLRVIILGRPPVANMFETLLFVPLIAMILASILSLFAKKRIFFQLAGITSLLLLSLAQFGSIQQDLENVQPVLNSNRWLSTHVLLVVGSYGCFALSAVLSHLFFFSKNKRLIEHGILYSIYAGLSLLIPGTLLGGIWAAESWGRFWDWDPKESWAFISICTYLLFVHAYRFHKIAEFGLALGGIIGFLAISFTWYGVNYILGTGFHSYGFGNGGEFYYYAYFIIELLFVAYLCLNYQKLKPSSKTS